MFGWFASRRRVDDPERELADLRVKVVACASQASMEKLHGSFNALHEQHAELASDHQREIYRINETFGGFGDMVRKNDSRVDAFDTSLNVLKEEQVALAGRLVKVEDLAKELAVKLNELDFCADELEERLDLLSGEKVEVEVEVEGEGEEAEALKVSELRKRYEDLAFRVADKKMFDYVSKVQVDIEDPEQPRPDSVEGENDLPQPNGETSE